MSIFISYSHQDKEFVEKLAGNLVKHKARVWVDTWELSVGDSIIQKIQTAIQKADALIVVLSKASVESEWCKKELTSGLLRELEEKRVVVLPLLLEDCEIPLFLKDKLYADFRYSFDEGLRTTLEAIAKVTSDTLGRLDYPKFYVDYAIDWFLDSKLFHLRITLLEHAVEQPYSIITEIIVEANEAATKRYKEYAEAGLDWFGRYLIIEMLGNLKQDDELYFILDDSLPKYRSITVRDPETGMEYEVLVNSRRIGEDNGKDIFIDWGNQLHDLINSFREGAKHLPSEVRAKIVKIIKEGSLPDTDAPAGA